MIKAYTFGGSWTSFPVANFPHLLLSSVQIFEDFYNLGLEDIAYRTECCLGLEDIAYRTECCLSNTWITYLYSI